MKKLAALFIVSIIFISCKEQTANQSGSAMTVSQYFNYGDSGVQVAGIKMIPIKTPAGEFKVWVKRFGNNPRIKDSTITWRACCYTSIHGMF